MELRQCSCGGNAELKTEYYPGTKYKMYRVHCTDCFRQTNACRKLSDAENEWNSPEKPNMGQFLFPSVVKCPTCGESGYVYYIAESDLDYAKCTRCGHYLRKGERPMATLDKT